MNIVTLELLGCWCKYEEFIVANYNNNNNNSNNDNKELIAIIPTTVHFLRLSVPLLLNIFNSNNFIISNSVIGCCNKLVSLMKYQINNNNKIENIINNSDPVFKYYLLLLIIIKFFFNISFCFFIVLFYLFPLYLS